MSLRDKAKQQLPSRSKEAYDSKDSSGMYETIFKKDLESVKFWKCENGEHSINILPFEVGNHFPTCSPYEHIKPGDAVYFLDIWVHRGVGINEASVVCPGRNFGQPCPICEDLAEKRKEDDGSDKKYTQSLKDITPKRRTVYNIICLDSDEEEKKGVQVWEVAHFFMQKHLAARAKKRKGGGYISFASPDEGKEVVFEKSGSKTQTEFTAHNFEDRDGYIIEDSDLEQTKSLDELVILYTYEQIDTMYYGKEKKEEEEEEEDIPIDPSPEEEPAKEEEPATRTRTRATIEEPVKTEENKCPNKKVFGIDADKYPECNDCDMTLWEECSKLSEENKKKEPVKTRTRRG